VNNHSIPLTHAERKNTVHSHKHSFTPYPSLSPYKRTDGMTDREMNTLAACGLEDFFPVVLLCQLFGSGRKLVLVLLTCLEYNTVRALC
jgi:hypothetical protein